MNRNKWLGLSMRWTIGLYILVDILCIGMGMGVPIFCILLGFPVGWLIVIKITSLPVSVEQVFKKVLPYALMTAGVTLAGMLIIWLPFAANLFIPGKDLASTGIPMILYDPKASFIGWVVLMIVISPVLQMLATLFGSHLAMLYWLSHQVKTSPRELP